MKSNDEMTIRIDGSQGEGGGQIVRTALALSAITGKPFELEKIRARRGKPGLLRQHLTCVLAAAEICGAKVEGAKLRSTALRFEPGNVRSGTYRWNIGSAGSTSLVMQTVLFPLLLSEGESVVRIEGGTHNGKAPPYEFLAMCFGPEIAKMGFTVSFELERYGFYPAGGGCLVARLTGSPGKTATPLELLDRAVIGMEVFALSSGIPDGIGKAAAELIGEALGIEASSRHVLRVASDGPGNAVQVLVGTDDGTLVFTSFGEKGLALEAVGGACVGQVRRWLGSGARVDEYLQDQLLLPMALRRGGKFTTEGLSGHTTTNMEIIRKFLDIEFTRKSLGGNLWEIGVEPKTEGSGI